MRGRLEDVDVFKIHEQLIDDYRSFTSGSVEVRDRRIRAHVDQQLSEGHQWPDSLKGAKSCAPNSTPRCSTSMA